MNKYNLVYGAPTKLYFKTQQDKIKYLQDRLKTAPLTIYWDVQIELIKQVKKLK